MRLLRSGLRVRSSCAVVGYRRACRRGREHGRFAIVGLYDGCEVLRLVPRPARPVNPAPADASSSRRPGCNSDSATDRRSSRLFSSPSSLVLVYTRRVFVNWRAALGARPGDIHSAPTGRRVDVRLVGGSADVLCLGTLAARRHAPSSRDRRDSAPSALPSETGRSLHVDQRRSSGRAGNGAAGCGIHHALIP